MEIDHALYLAHGMAVVYESCVQKGFAVPFTSTDAFSISRAGTVVRYRLNGALIYTSLVPSIGVVFADASLYSGGDAITAASFAAQASPGISAASLLPVAGTVANRDYTSSEAALPPMAGAAGANPTCSSYGVFAPLVGAASNFAYTGSAAALAPLTAQASAGALPPSYAVSAGAFAYLLSAARVLVGEVAQSSAALAPLRSISADRSYATSETSLAPLTTFSGQATVLDGFAQLALRGPYRVVMRGTEQAPNKLAARLPRPLVTLAGGATARLRMPAATVTMTGTGVVVGRIRARMALPLVSMSGTTGSIGGIKAVMPDQLKVQAFGGAVIEATPHDRYTVKVAGQTGSVGKVRARMPLFVVEAAGATVNVGRIEALMPMLRPVASGILRALMPMGRLTAIGTAVVALEYEGYAMNLLDPTDKNPANNYEPSGDEVTHYTNFPFNQIVRHGDKYYGVSATGLFLLGGDTDAGAPIPWAVRTATTDFGSIQQKTVVSVYVGGTVQSSAVATVFAGERAELSYSYPVPPSASEQNYRVKFGRGLKTRYFALELADELGGQMLADTVDFELNKLTRAL